MLDPLKQPAISGFLESFINVLGSRDQEMMLVPRYTLELVLILTLICSMTEATTCLGDHSAEM